LNMKYDVVIIGSGLGGLECAYILSQEGLKVCVLEKNHQLGGCLQTFSRKGSIFDTGMHYIGSMDKGQTLYNFFKYFGISDKLKLRRLDESGYEIIRYAGKEYKYAMGYERFVETLVEQFPHEREALQKYADMLKEVSSAVDLYNLRDVSGANTRYMDYYSHGFYDFVNSLTQNQSLRSVLFGTSPLYSGVKNRTPLYIPVIIHSSYIESAYRFVDGGSQISHLLEKSILEQGGTILRKAEVTGFDFHGNMISAVEINHSEKIEGKNFISNIHPKHMLDLMEASPFRPAYRKRIESIEDTYGIFTLYLSLKENSFKYINKNFYHYDTLDVWDGDDYNENSWPKGYMLHFSPDSDNSDYTRSVIMNTYLKWSEVEQWEHTTVEKRGEEYKAFKRIRAEKMLDNLERDFPGIRNAVDSYYTSTPLTYRDYTSTTRGSIYGILKDYNNPLKTIIVPRTTVPNLLLTGQNINIHGVIGVTISAILTCGELIGTPYLLNKMRHAL
jgi:all-trans-retinol 13,14-reductase